ncbi:MAG: hypothetical protein HOY76_21825 [Streptomyces sp.]|nr:hypothetical protein [Streptomyces sp.]NUS09877.1 hypothetical protein [Streptomyces sp.]
MHIEDRLGHALGQAAEGCTLEAQPLMDRGLRRGLQLRRRRRITAAAGTALAVGLIGTGIGYGVTALPGPAPTTPAPAHPDGNGTAMSGQEILTLLKSLLPPGRVTQEQAIGAGGGRPAMGPATASLVFDDGHGPARFELGAARTNNKDVLASERCPTPPSKHGTCSETRLRDGSVVSVFKTSFNGKSGTAGTLQWDGTIVTPAGDRLWLDEYNYGTAGFPASGTRPAPPLTPAQLITVVSDKGWNRLFAAIRYAMPDHQLTGKQVFAKTLPLLPPGMHTGGAGSNQEGIAGLELDRGPYLLDVNVTRWPGAAARSEIAAQYYAHAQKLPDGTLLLVDTRTDHNRVYALHPNGVSVQLMVNSSLRTNTTPPPLSVAQLKAIALDKTWNH